MTKQAPKVRVSQPPPVLAKLVNRPGGILREQAIARSQQNLETQRDAAHKALLGLIDMLDAMSDPPPDRLPELRRNIDRLIAIADTFGMGPLAQAARRLSELLLVFRDKSGACPGAIAVHLRAMRLFAGAAPDEAKVKELIGELDRVLTHFGAQVPQGA
jgi:hypothetical protein